MSDKGIKSSVYAVMADAYAEASDDGRLPAIARMIGYAARRLSGLGDALKLDYFLKGQGHPASPWDTALVQIVLDDMDANTPEDTPERACARLHRRRLPVLPKRAIGCSRPARLPSCSRCRSAGFVSTLARVRSRTFGSAGIGAIGVRRWRRGLSSRSRRVRRGDGTGRYQEAVPSERQAAA